MTKSTDLVCIKFTLSAEILYSRSCTCVWDMSTRGFAKTLSNVAKWGLFSRVGSWINWIQVLAFLGFWGRQTKWRTRCSSMNVVLVRVLQHTLEKLTYSLDFVLAYAGTALLVTTVLLMRHARIMGCRRKAAIFLSLH